MTRLDKWLGLDERWSQSVRIGDDPGPVRWGAVIFAHSGDSWFWLAGIGLVWFLGNAAWKERMLLFTEGILLTALLVMVIKLVVRRERPEGEWGNIYRRTDPHSFPSGHAARAFMLAVLTIGNGPAWLAIVLILWAPLVSLARVGMGVHYLSDVLAGFVIGLIVGVAGLVLFPLSLGWLNF